MLLSLLIPCWNEEKTLGLLLDNIEEQAFSFDQLEILVIDGGSSDQTRQIAQNRGVKLVCSQKGRAHQMNAGAKEASGDILYFVHADSQLPHHFDQKIRKAIHSDRLAGCFRMQFDRAPWILQGFAWMSRFNYPICRGGDQSLFITKSFFEELQGFDEAYTIYEDSEFIRRIYKTGKFKVLPATLITSSRKYKNVGWLYLQTHFGLIHLKYYLGHSPEELAAHYQRHIQAKEDLVI